METQKDKELTKWARVKFEEYTESLAHDGSFDWYDLGTVFLEGIRLREQYLIDTYFKEPEGEKLTSPNLNTDGFVSLETRIKALKAFHEETYKAWITQVGRNPQNFGIKFEPVQPKPTMSIISKACSLGVEDHNACPISACECSCHKKVH